MVPLSLIFPFFIHSSWNFHSSHYHPLLFHPYHAHEVVLKTHEHAFYPNPRNGDNEGMTTMEYCLSPLDLFLVIRPAADPFHRQHIPLQESIHGCIYPPSFYTEIYLVVVIYDAWYGKIYP